MIDDERPVHQPECFNAPIPGRQWFAGCSPDRPRVNADGVCEECGRSACPVCGLENCPESCVSEGDALGSDPMMTPNERKLGMTVEQISPQGPQFADADLTVSSDDDLRGLATIVDLDLRAAISLHGEGKISDEELSWVRQDAAKLEAELERRFGKVIEDKEAGE